jgi:hypothetical protein
MPRVGTETAHARRVRNVSRASFRALRSINRDASITCMR